MRGSREDRFWVKVDQNGPVHPYVPELGPCWLWVGSRNTFGHGALRSGGHKGYLEKAHRISWEIHQGPINEERRILHNCDNPPCVNPDHLYEGTQRDNTLDAVVRGRHKTPFGTLPHPRGEAMGRAAKLTTVDVLAIRARSASGETNASIARDYPVGQDQIGHIVQRKSWRHIP